MGDVVNLNQYRKERAKHRRRQRAAENQLRMGRGKHDHSDARRAEERRNKELDGKRLKPTPSTDEPPTAS